MNYSTYRFTLDIHQTRSQVSIPVMFQDTWVRFLVNLTDGGKPYTLEGVSRVVLYGKKKDGTTLTEDCAIDDTGTRIEYTFSPQTASAIGPVECEFRLYSTTDGLHITSPSFGILVEERVVEDEDLIPSDSERSAIDRIFESEAERVDAEAERTAAEAERVAAEAKRAEADALRQDPQAVIAEANKYTDEKVAGKLDVPTGANHIWSTDQNGTLGYQTWSQSASGRSLVRRTPYGQVKIKDAVADDDAVPLAQMNTALADKASGADLADLVSRVVELEQNGGGSNKIYTVDSTPAYMKKVPANVAQYAEVRKVGAISEEVINCFSADALINECNSPSDTEGVHIDYSGSQEEGYEFHCYPHTLGASYTTAKTLRELFPYAKAGVPYMLAYDTSELPEDDEYYTYYSGSLDIPCASRYQYGILRVFTDAELDNGHMNISGGSFSFHDYEMDQYMDEPVEETFSNIRLVKYGYDIGDKTVTPVTAVVSYGKNLFNCLSEEVSGDATVTDRTESTITVTATSKGKNVLIPIPFRIPDGTKVSISGSWTTTGKARGSIQLVWAYSSSTSSCFTLSVSGGTKTGAATGSSSYDGYFAVRLGTNYATTPDVGDSVTFNNIQVEIGDATSWSPFMSHTIAFPAEVQALPAYGRGADEEHFNHIAWDENGKATYVQMVDENLNVLPTPVITDISHLITDDNLIQVESGGRMVFVNKYLDSAQNTIYYEMKA